MSNDVMFKLQLAAIAVFGLLVALLTWKQRPASQSNHGPAAESDLEARIEEARGMAPDLSIAEMKVPVIDRSPGDKVLTYLVEAKVTNEYWFDAKDYRLDYRGDLTKFDPDTLTAAIDRAYETHTSFPSELKATLKLAVVDVDVPLRSLLELAGLYRGVTKLDVERVDLAVKGYADGEKSADWKYPVTNLDQSYQEFSILNPSDPTKVNWLFYRQPEVPREISFPYHNADLPDLRAQFIRHDFLEQYVPRLANGRACNIYVLHNAPLETANQKEWRKAQIYVMVYLKRPAE